MTQMLNLPNSLTNRRDLVVLNELRGHLLTLINTHPRSYSSLSATGQTPDDRALRIAVMNTRQLLNLEQLYFVGFFGQKKPFIPAPVKADLTRLDRHLSSDLVEYPFILAYCSMELGDRYNWANLVIFSELEGINQWKDTQHHRHASGQVSPLYFDNVRIHLGRLEAGLTAPFVVARTNFYDFQK